MKYKKNIFWLLIIFNQIVIDYYFLNRERDGNRDRDRDRRGEGVEKEREDCY